MIFMSHPYEIERPIISNVPFGSYTVLDVGIGKGVFGYLLRAERLINGYLVGLDIHCSYLNIVKYHRVYDDLVLCDVRFLPFRDGSFDLVIATEVIEHLEKKNGMRLLDNIEHIARKRVIITTPNGFMPQGPLNGTKTEIHISGWHVRDFKNRGYRVLGIGFKLCKAIKGSWRLWGLFHHLFTPISYLVPWLGEQLVAIKDLEAKSYERS